MRKKYLSALLFGALLLASAGTFTSCSDYDDDIKNLQEQINTVVSDLESLKTKVDGLGGYVTDVKVENGKLVVTANGSTVSYDLPAGGSSEVANIEIKDGHLYVNGTDKGSVGSTVTVNEEGKLVIDGEVSDLKVGTEVIIKDASNGMYTISIDGQTIQLPMASAVINFVESTATYFTNINAASQITDNAGGIHWATASKDIEWKGALGNISKDDLLVGGISTANVTVSPATFDLGSAELSLVDTEGNVAEVEVSAVSYSNSPLADATRAASKDGSWILSVKPTNKVTGDNILDAYTHKNSAGQAGNIRYALAVDGRVVSDYNFRVDVWHEAITNQNVTFVDKGLTYNGDKTLVKNSSITLPVGDCTLEYREQNCADAYFSFEGTNVELAKQYGLEANGMTIKMTQEFAASRKSIKVVLHMLGINGVVVDKELTLNSNATTVDGAVEAEKTTYKVAYAADKTSFETIKIDLGTLITANMTNDEIEAVDPSRISFEIADDKGTSFIVAPNTITALNNLYVGDDKFVANNSLAQVTSLQIPVTSIQSTAEVGSYTLVMTVKDDKGTGTTEGNEIKKFNFPIDITVPTFNELFKKAGNWNEAGNAVTLKLSDASTPSVDFIGTLSSESFDVASNLSKFAVEFNDVNNGKKDVAVKNIVTLQSNGQLQVADKNSDKKADLIVEGAYLPLTGTVSYKFGGKLVVESETVTVNLKSLLDGASLKNYAEGAEKALTVSKASGTATEVFTAGTADGKTKDNGLALVVNGKKYALNGADVNGINLTTATITTKLDGYAGSKARADYASGVITFNNMQTGNYTTILTITITEANTGISTDVTIPVSVNM